MRALQDVRLCSAAESTLCDNVGDSKKACKLKSRVLICRDGQCPEYSGEEQAICAVGLAKVRPGVFIEAIKYVIVLATPVEVRVHWMS